MKFSLKLLFMLLQLGNFELLSQNKNITIIDSTKEQLTNIDNRERIYYTAGGHSAEVNQFPYLVSLKRYPRYEHFCSGSIITNRHVLTAAHCFCKGIFYKEPHEMIITAGSEILNTAFSQKYRVLETICHPEYDNIAQFHDIGLLVSFNDFIFSKRVSTVPTYSSTLSVENMQVIIPGWGSAYERGPPSQYLQYIEVPTIPLSTCLKMLRNLKLDAFLREWNICSYHQVSKTCSMDSGGPVLYRNAIVGIVSWSDGCETTVPDIHTSVFKHLNWIVNEIKWVLNDN